MSFGRELVVLLIGSWRSKLILAPLGMPTLYVPHIHSIWTSYTVDPMIDIDTLQYTWLYIKRKWKLKFYSVKDYEVLIVDYLRKS